MPKTTGKTISLIEILPPQTSYEEEDEENFLDIPARAIATRISEIPVEVLSKGLFKFVDALGDILKDLPNQCGAYNIDELTFDLSITGTGEVSLVAAGVKAGFASGVKITLKKPSKDTP